MKKIIIFALSIVFAITCFAGISKLNAKNVVLAEQQSTDMTNVTNGISFSEEGGIRIEDRTFTLPTLTKTPLSFQLLFRAPEGSTEDVGVLLSSYKDEVSNAFGIEVAPNGAPQVYFQNDGVASVYAFDGAKAQQGGYTITWANALGNWLNNVFLINPDSSSEINGDEYININTGYMIYLGIVLDVSENKIHLMLNGYAIATITTSQSFEFDSENNLMVGRDHSSEQTRVFLGEIKTIALYSDLRGDNEFHGDYVRLLDSNDNTYKPTTTSLKKLGGSTRLHLYDDALICAYDFTLGSDEYHKDLTGNGNNLTIVDSRAVTYAPSLNNGKKFVESEQFTIAQEFTEVPLTLQAEIYLPEGYQARGGVILGNYDKQNADCCFCFEVGTNGKAKVYVDNGSQIFNQTLANSDVRTGAWAHLTFVFDEEKGELRCYIDGALTDTVTSSYVTPVLDAFNFRQLMIGGDYREGNLQSFKGRIRNIAMFSDVRSEEEIASDALNGFDANEEDLIAFYDLNQVDEENEIIEDLSGNGFDAIDSMWLNADEVDLVEDFAYSFAVIGDTQIVNYYYNQNLSSIYDWLVANAQTHKIEHVFGMGDITDKNADFEWQSAVEQATKLDNANISYSMIRGNHDTNEKMNDYFGYDAYTNQFNGFYVRADGTYDLTNSYRTLEVGTTKYLLLTLDYGPTDDILAWAGEICKEYYNHKVIITTHAYANSDKTTLGDGDSTLPPNNHGEDIWQKFASKYGNIYLILSGHVAYDDIIYFKNEGEQGNEVTQMLIDNQYTDKWHGGTGMITMLYFSEDGSKITIRNYSPVRNQYFKVANQYELDMSTKEYVHHEHVLEKIISEKAIKNGATCHSSTEYYYTCGTCGVLITDLSFFGNDPFAPHKFENFVFNNDATHNLPGTETAKCSYEGCNCVKVRVKIGSELSSD